MSIQCAHGKGTLNVGQGAAQVGGFAADGYLIAAARGSTDADGDGDSAQTSAAYSRP